MMYKLIFLCLLAISWCLPSESTRTVSGCLSSNDISRFQSVYAEGLSSDDLQSIYFSLVNIEAPKTEIKNSICKKLLTLHKESKLNDFEKDFYIIGINKQLKCTEKLPETILSKIASFKSDALSPQEIFYRVSTQKLLDINIDDNKPKIVKNLQELLKKDDSLISLGYAFNVAFELGSSAAFVADRLEDAIIQADEVDGRMLQFEGGLSITSLIVNGAFKIAKTFNKPVPITAEQAVKLTNYFYSRRSVQSPKGAHVLIEAINTINTVKNVAPICIKLIGNGQLHSGSSTLTIAVLDLLGKPLSQTPQNIYGKVFSKKHNSVLAEKVNFVTKSSDKTIFEAELNDYKPARGIYQIEIGADNLYKQTLQFKILSKVKIHSLEISIAETDTSSANKQTFSWPQENIPKLTVDTTQKLLMKTVLVDERNIKPISVHQAFVRFSNDQNEEIIFIAEQDSNGAYKFDIDIGLRSGDFNHKSGVYHMHLIVGDTSLFNSINSHLADIKFKFIQDAKDSKKPPTRTALPIIEHKFREAEKRPPRIVSDIFTGLCLTPLALLFIFWYKLDVNVSNFVLSPSTIGFHIGFGGILTLFAVFWLKLNMFETLRLLIPIAIFTFLCGNRLLRRIYTQRVLKASNTAATS